ncbi:MAG: hypothetical protein L3K03_05700 [Thermoplasmata archaeon]|nr:hypothetical protein [Thermoplasmata archaeon]
MAVRGSPIVDERALFASFPFLPGADQMATALARSLRDLLTDATLSPARQLGQLRVLRALEDPTGGASLPEIDAADPEVAFLSFQFARVVLSAGGTPAGLRRWAVAESKRAMRPLLDSPPDTIGDVAQRLGYDFQRSPYGISMGIADYLLLGTPVREEDFRLAQQRVHNGRVEVTAERAARLLQEGIRRTLSTPLPLSEDVVTFVRDREASFLVDVVARVPTVVSRPGAVGPLRAERFPPCIRKMRRALEAGENLSHSGRFALAAFLHRAGADAETIVDSFRGAPDFDEGITRYQVEHITHRNGGEGYSPPECATLRSHGLCVRDGDPTAPNPPDRMPDRLCHEPDLNHPLQYYQRSARYFQLPAGRPSGGPGSTNSSSPEGGAAGHGTSGPPDRSPSTGPPPGSRPAERRSP